MAYLLGLVTTKEIKELKRRGWEIVDGKDIIEEASDTYKAQKGMTENPDPDSYTPQTFVGVWVDTNLFDIMDGPDWDKGK